jgi:hypothetical protein
MAGTQGINVVLRLLNARRFRSEILGSAASVRAFTQEVEAAGTASSGMALAGNAARSSLYAIGSASRVAALGIGTIAGFATAMGLSFDATMESNTLAFEKFTGSAQSAREMLNQLFEIAAATPFTFADITTAARRLQAFGFDAQETTKWIKILGDTISYTGGSADEVFRAVKAIGEIRGIGRLQQRQILQLTNLGINAHDILTKNLGLTEKQLHNIGKAGISAEEALGALEKGLSERYGGGAAKYSKTFKGQIEKLKDYTQRAAGQLVKPLFDVLEKRTFPSINDWLSGGKGAKGKGGGKQVEGGFVKLIPKIQGAAVTVGKVVAGAFLVLKGAVGQLLDALKPAQPFLQNVLIPLFKGLAEGVIAGVVAAFEGLILIIKILAPVLGFIGKVLAPVKFLFEAIGFVIGFIAAGAITEFVGALGKAGGIFRIFAGIAKLVLIPFRAFEFLMRGIIGVGWAVTRFIGEFGGRFGALAGEVVGAVNYLREFGSFISGFIDGVIVSVAERLGSFGEGFLNLGLRIKDLFVKGLKGVGEAIIRAFVGGAAFALGIGGAIRKWINDHTLFGNTVNVGLFKLHIPKLASGGYVSQGGFAMVGERGPEIVGLPSGSTVYPNQVAKASLSRSHHRSIDSAAAKTAPAFEGVNVHLTAPVIIDKREVGMAVGTYYAERKARA